MDSIPSHAEHPILPTTTLAEAGTIWLARLATAGMDSIDDDDLDPTELAERDAQRHHSRQTITSYQTALILFTRWVERSGRRLVRDLRLDDLLHYTHALRKRDYDLSLRRTAQSQTASPSGKRLAPRTIHSYTRPLLGFFTLLDSFEAIPFRTETVRAELARALPRLPETVAPTPPDLRRLVNFYDRPPAEDDRTARLRLIRLRNAALLHLLFSSGGRISEILSLNVGHVYRDRQVQSRVPVWSKGRRAGVLFVRRHAERALGTYVRARESLASSMPLFESYDRRTAGARLSRSSGWRIVHYAAQAVATQIELEGKHDEASLLRTTSPHTFRHFVGFYLLNEGVELAEVSQILRHRSVEVTRNFYARYKDEQLQEVHDQFSSDPYEEE